MADDTVSQTQKFPTRSGKSIFVRPVTAADEALLEEFFDRVSDEDRRFRFLSAHKHLTHEQLAPMVEVDHQKTESFIAFDGEGEGAQVVGHALLACDNALDTGEVAVSVCNSWRGQGVGWALLDVLAEAGRERGVRRVISIEDRENHAAIELEREKGFTPHAVEGDPRVVLLEKLLR